MNLTLILALLITSNWEGPGTSVLSLLRLGQGPRAAAMGEAGTALADDATTLYWNPAGLGKISDYHLALSHQIWFGGTHDEIFHTVLPVKTGSLGLGLLYSATPDIEFWDEENLPGDTFSTWDALLSFGYGIALAPNYHLGIGLKAGYENLYQSRGFGGGLDLGFVGQPRSGLGAGVALRNCGIMKYSASHPLPAEIAAGLSYTYERFKAVADAVFAFYNQFNLRFGIEYLPVRELSLRIGYRSGPADLNSLGYSSGITAGLGINLAQIGFDYSLAPYGKLGICHRLGLRLRFARSGGLGALNIRVIDAQTRQPLWANVSLTGVKNFSGETNRQGELEISGLLPGRIIIHTSRTGYISRSDTLLILGDREQSAVIGLQPIRYGMITGTIYDAATYKPLTGSITYRGPVYGEQPADPQLGTFAIRSIPSGIYLLTAQGPEPYLPQTCTLKLEPEQIANKDFYLVKPRQTIVLEGINFETGKADILPKFYPVLDRAGRILKENPGIVVELAGHTDPREINTAQFPSNWELSQARAEAVRYYLIEKFQIEPSRLIARGYADTQPIAPNDTDEGMAKNRRTEFRIIEEDGNRLRLR
jgi:outer membrane protein OmpA-like peptidoglycan-associated protein